LQSTITEAHREIVEPRPGFQVEALQSPADHTLIGGIAGPGKTFILCLMAIVDCSGLNSKRAINYYEIPRYRATLFRREDKQAEEMIDDAGMIYESLGAKWSESKRRFEFPSGARVKIANMKNVGDWTKHRGKETHFYGFDELCEFMEVQFRGVLPWLRSTVPGVRPRLAGTCNWEGVGVQWVKDYWKVKCPCPEHKGKNKLFERKIVVQVEGKRIESSISCLFIPGRRENSYLQEKDPGYLARVAVDCGGVDTPRFRALGLGCCEVSEGSFFPELDRNVHIIPDGFTPARHHNFVGIGGHDHATSANGDASAFTRILTNEDRDIIVDNFWIGWGKSVPEQAELFLPLYESCEVAASGADIFASNQAGSDIKSVAQQFVLEPPRVEGKNLPEIHFVKASIEPNVIASILRSALKAAKEGRPGGLYFRKRCQHIYDDMAALMTDAKDFEVWKDQRITLEWKGVKHQYHFDAFHAMIHAVAWVYTTKRLPAPEPSLTVERKRNIEKRNQQTISYNCRYSPA
jgi:hypothetical protein